MYNTIAEVRTEFIKYVRETKCSSTLHTYNARLKMLDSIAEESADNLNAESIQKVLDKMLQSEQYSVNTVRNVFDSINAMIQFAEDKAMMKHINLADVHIPESVSACRHILNDLQISKLIEKVRDTELFLPVVIASGTGLGRKDVLSLRWSDVDFNTHTIHVSYGEYAKKRVFTSKTIKSRTVSMSPRLEGELVVQHRLLEAKYPYAEIQNQYICKTVNDKVFAPTYFNKRFRNFLNTDDGFFFPKDISFYDIANSYRVQAGESIKNIADNTENQSCVCMSGYFKTDNANAA